jgi:hypothetical protein
MMIPDRLLPEKYREHAFIAGGFAACPALASDMDVWVLAPCPFVSAENGRDGYDINDPRIYVHLQQARKKILDHLHTQFPRYAIKEETSVRVSQDSETEIDRQSIYHATVDHVSLKVAKLTIFTPWIQIMVTDASWVRQVLDGFDISTHAVAITGNGVQRGSHWTPITEPPVVIRSNDKTPERMVKICNRYGLKNPMEATTNVE